MKLPASVAIPTVNSLALVIPVTGNVPLNPELPKPVVLTLDLMLINSTWEPTERLCGSSVRICAVLAAQRLPAINLKFLFWF